VFGPQGRRTAWGTALLLTTRLVTSMLVGVVGVVLNTTTPLLGGTDLQDSNSSSGQQRSAEQSNTGMACHTGLKTQQIEDQIRAMQMRAG